MSRFRDGRTAAWLPVALALAVVVLPSVTSVPVQAGTDGPGPRSVVDGGAADGQCPNDCVVPEEVVITSIFPLRGDRETPDDADEEVIGLTDERTDEVFDVLASETARELLRLLGEQPLTATELTEQVDTSLPNVHYHLENLREVGAIEVLDVEYSERGREMKVYTAVYRPLVVVSGATE